ncbi:MAG: hypothetical protein IE909_09435 [Campylobacterales bacterium]|nr:hypothetical protein [Campylobacterales bacterium]
MFKNNVSKIFPFVQSLYDVSELILVGSDIDSWLNIVSGYSLEKVHYINQGDQNYSFETLPQNWEASSKLLAKEDGQATFYTLSNPMLNGTVSSDMLVNLWQNLETFESIQKDALSLKTFLDTKCGSNSSKMIVLDSFDGLLLVDELGALKVDVVALRVVADDEEAFANVSEQKVEQKLQECGYKNIATYEDNHPKIKTAVYVLDHKQQSKTLQNEKQSLEEKLKAIPELENKIKTLEENIHKEKTAKEATQKELAELKTQLENKTKELQEKNDIIKNLIVSKESALTTDYLNTLNTQEKVKTIVLHAMHQEDILESIDFYVLGNELNDEEKFEVCCEFARQIAKSGDRMQGVGFVNNAKLFLAQDEKLQEEQYKKLINLATSLNQLNIAVDFEMEYNAKYGIFQDSVSKKLFEEYKKIRNASNKKQQHGQDLLIDYINENIKDGEGKGKVMVEVGTTRENVPGQGSTLQFASLCKRKGIKFITVDMDAHNTHWASFLSNKYDLNIEAVTKKGEDFLKHDIDAFDFVFLDAYDFDHEKHSELRQSRYRKYLGSKIDEKKAHKMHLKCAKSVVKKLKKDGVVCVDHTWQDEDGEWAAKGTLAVPYLIKKEFKIIDKRNQAVLLGKKKK